VRNSNPVTPESVETEAFSYERWKDSFLRLMLVGGTILGLVAAVVSGIDVVRSGNPVLAYVYGAAWLILLVVTVGPWPYALRAGVVLVLFYALGVAGLLENGMRGDGRMFLLGFTIMAAMLVNPRAGVFALVGSVVTIGVVGAVALTGTYHLLSKVTPVGSLLQWLVSTIILVLLQTTVLLALTLFLREFRRALDRVRRGVDELARERSLLRTVIDNIPDAVYAKDASGRRQLSNPADARLMGFADRQEALGRTGAEVLSPDTAEQVLAEDRDVLRTGEPVINKEMLITDPGGRQHWLLVSKLPLRGSSGEVTGILGIDRDITERRRSEEEQERLREQLRLSQRMESIGRLAGGLAHDINNLLAPILGFTEILLADLPAGDNRAESLRQIRGAAVRVRDLVRKLFAFGKRQDLALRPVDLRAVVQGFEKLLRPALRQDIELTLRLPETLGIVRADVSAIEEVIMNVVLNAQEAMPKGGMITLALKDESPQEAAARESSEAGPAAGVIMEISDTGHGMDQATAQHVFEPFFTTKAEGTGLGLSTVYGIVRQHGGTVHLRSEPMKGATFTVVFPRHEE
jgi:PAS domain S-box-containing protein